MALVPTLTGQDELEEWEENVLRFPICCDQLEMLICHSIRTEKGHTGVRHLPSFLCAGRRFVVAEGSGGSVVMCKSAVKGESLGIQEGPSMDVILMS